MKKMLIGAVAALTAGASLAAAVPASAQPYRGHYYGHRDNSGAVVAAGIAGLAIGAALAGNHNNGYYGYGPRHYRSYPAYYGYGYDDDYGYGYAYRCRTELRWNWRWGEYERIRICR